MRNQLKLMELTRNFLRLLLDYEDITKKFKLYDVKMMSYKLILRNYWTKIKKNIKIKFQTITKHANHKEIDEHKSPKKKMSRIDDEIIII